MGTFAYSASSIKLVIIQTVVVKIARGNVDEVLFFWSLEMKITRILAENSLNMHNCGVRNKRMNQIMNQILLCDD